MPLYLRSSEQYRRANGRKDYGDTGWGIQECDAVLSFELSLQ